VKNSDARKMAARLLCWQPAEMIARAISESATARLNGFRGMSYLKVVVGYR
jgi:hypothetical protein